MGLPIVRECAHARRFRLYPGFERAHPHKQTLWGVTQRTVVCILLFAPASYARRMVVNMCVQVVCTSEGMLLDRSQLNASFPT